MKKQFLFFFLLPCLYIWVPNPSPLFAASSPRYLMKFATVAPEGSTWVKYIRAVDKELRQKSNNRLGLRIYAGGIAGDELDVLKKMRIGQIHSAAFSGVGFGKILPEVRVLDLPYLFRNSKQVDEVHETLRPYFEKQFEKKGFQLLSWAEVGDVNLFSKKTIKNMQDLKGLKIWVWSGDPIAKETFEAMGVTPIPLAVTDVTTALNTGMIDTVYAPPLGALALQWQTHLDFMMALPMVHSTGAILVSDRYYRKLPKDLADLLKKTLQESMKKLTTELREQNQEAITVIKASGLTIIPPPDGKTLESFYRIHDQVAQSLTGKIYSKALLNQVYEILQRKER